MTDWLHLVLLIALVVVALDLARLRDLFAAAMLTGFFSLLCAVYYTIVDAVDVAFTEAAVGAGLSTVLMLGALSLLDERVETGRVRNRIGALSAALAVAAMMLYATPDMPAYGDPTSPVNQPDRPAWRYVHQSGKEIGVPNIVTSVLASYRGYDTLGETNVIFTAGLAVYALLAGVRRKRGQDAE